MSAFRYILVRLGQIDSSGNMRPKIFEKSLKNHITLVLACFFLADEAEVFFFFLLLLFSLP